MKKSSALEWLYLVTALAEIGSEVVHHDLLRLISKPLLMPILMIWFLQQVARPLHMVKWIFVASLFFSWVGDVALMFVPSDPTDLEVMGIPKNPLFFLVGLGGFLLTHLMYIYCFLDVPQKTSSGPLQQSPVSPVTLALGSYFIGLVFLVFPAIPSEMLIPVSIYSATIAVMVLSAYNRKGRVAELSFRDVFLGGLLFLFSDSLIAASKFKFPGMDAGVYIMVLYIAAQYLITRGLLRRWETSVS